MQCLVGTHFCDAPASYFRTDSVEVSDLTVLIFYGFHCALGLSYHQSYLSFIRLLHHQVCKCRRHVTYHPELMEMQISSEEMKAMEVLKLQKMLDSLNDELNAAKLATISEQKKNSTLERQIDAIVKDKAMLESSLIEMGEVRKENLNLKV